MRPSPQCLHNTRRALYRVFVPPSEAAIGASRSGVRHQQQQQRPQPRPGRSIASRCQLQIREYATSKMPARGPRGETSVAARDRVAREQRGFDTRFTTQADIDRSGRDRPPRDHEITDPQIMVIDNGAMEGPLATPFVLTKLDQASESLRMISPYVPADAKNGRPKPEFAVCKIVNKKDEYERQKQVKERKKAAAAKPKTKELEFTWAISEHDLTTKLRQMGGFLDKGFKVDVLVAKKKGSRQQVSASEAEAVTKKIREEVVAQGAREAKPATGQVGATMRFYLEGKQK